MSSTIPGYDLDLPTAFSARSRLRNLMGFAEGEAAWAAACGSLGLDPEADLTPGALMDVAKEMQRSEGPESICGLSLEIRLIGYNGLARDAGWMD